MPNSHSNLTRRLWAIFHTQNSYSEYSFISRDRIVNSNMSTKKAAPKRGKLARTTSSNSIRSANSHQTSNTVLASRKAIHGLRLVERSHYVDEEGDVKEDEVLWRGEDKDYSENPVLRFIARCLVFVKLLPRDPADFGSLKCWVAWIQWLALLCDLAAAVVAVVTFNDVTYCCGRPILDFAANIQWKTATRFATYTYLALVVLEVYPVMRKGFPFNIVNPVLGFMIMFAMFWDDSKTAALIMWGVETAAVNGDQQPFDLRVGLGKRVAGDVGDEGILRSAAHNVT